MILGLSLAAVPPADLGEAAALAEQAGLDFVRLGDPSSLDEGPVGADPLSLAAFLMTTTRRIGLVSCVGDDWAPFNVARALASFDLLSGGRCGWVAMRAPGAETARSEEHLDVVLQLFDSWEDEALVFDKAESIFADRTKVHRIRHAGAYYTVDGPLNAPRPPQGRPVLFQPIVDAGAEADIVLTGIGDLDPQTRIRAGHARLVAAAPVNLGPSSTDAPDALAERLASAFHNRLCDGFLLTPADPAIDIPLLVEAVVPLLRAKGVMTPSHGERDFRTRLGLARPANRFAGQVGP
jgi:alkanesulfonate monooxygenase SsuD/methylene tetrahydromethanopterin reductase-like flavin-dependent oxidoreductase (luciferase family)